MTSTVSFKDKCKQAFAFFKWDLKACSGTIAVFGILATVFTTIFLTLCLVVGINANNEYLMLSSVSQNAVTPFEGSVIAFQCISVGMLYLMTTVFTIFYTIKVFSYLHNKRKGDMYGSLPVSRTTLYLTKAASAYIFSVLPTLFFMGIISLISVCLGQPLINEVTEVYLKIIIGALACISAYGLISVCCGTTFNSVIMFITVCIAYPLSAMFIKGTISSFFSGLYSGIFRNHFIMNALNPLAAYDGINVIYWIIFSAVCILAASLLIKRRKAERAQSSFAYYLPCHIVKVLVAFLSGMFLGVLFGSLNVFGNSLLGFIFGFVLGSIPAFIIAHLIFYKGFSRLIKTSVPLGGLIVFVIAGILLCNYDVFGYNSFLPQPDEIKGAGYFSNVSGYLNRDENYSDIIGNLADDFDDKEDQKKIIALHKQILSDSKLSTQSRFIGIWINMACDYIPISAYDDVYCFAYRMDNGLTATRVYSENLIEAINSIEGNYNVYYSVNDLEIVNRKEYIEKYSGLMRADIQDINEFCVFGNTKNDKTIYDNLITSISEYDKNKTAYEDFQKIREALKKDFEQNNTDLEKVMYYGFDSNDYDCMSPEALERAKKEYPDIVCEITFGANNTDSHDFSSIFSLILGNGNFCETHESYMIPKSFTNTLKALQETGILNKDFTFNDNCKYAFDEYSNYYTAPNLYGTPEIY